MSSQKKSKPLTKQEIAQLEAKKQAQLDRKFGYIQKATLMQTKVLHRTRISSDFGGNSNLPISPSNSNKCMNTNASYKELQHLGSKKFIKKVIVLSKPKLDCLDQEQFYYQLYMNQKKTKAKLQKINELAFENRNEFSEFQNSNSLDTFTDIKFNTIDRFINRNIVGTSLEFKQQAKVNEQKSKQQVLDTEQKKKKKNKVSQMIRSLSSTSQMSQFSSMPKFQKVKSPQKLKNEVYQSFSDFKFQERLGQIQRNKSLDIDNNYPAYDHNALNRYDSQKNIWKKVMNKIDTELHNVEHKKEVMRKGSVVCGSIDINNPYELTEQSNLEPFKFSSGLNSVQNSVVVDPKHQSITLMNKQRNIMHHLKLAERDALSKLHARKTFKKSEPWVQNLRSLETVPKKQPTVMDEVTIQQDLSSDRNNRNYGMSQSMKGFQRSCGITNSQYEDWKEERKSIRLEVKEIQKKEDNQRKKEEIQRKVNKTMGNFFRGKLLDQSQISISTSTQDFYQEDSMIDNEDSEKPKSIVDRYEVDRFSQLIREQQSKKQSFGQTCYSKLYDDPKFQKVSQGPLLSKMQGIYVKGSSVLQKEIKHCSSIPEQERIFYNDHHINEDGEGEPESNEIIIQKHMNKRSKIFK